LLFVELKGIFVGDFGPCSGVSLDESVEFIRLSQLNTWQQPT